MIEWFSFNVGFRQGCVMSPWLFNVYMDGVVREVNVRVLGKGLKLLSANAGRFEIAAHLRLTRRRSCMVTGVECM